MLNDRIAFNMGANDGTHRVVAVIWRIWRQNSARTTYNRTRTKCIKIRHHICIWGSRVFIGIRCWPALFSSARQIYTTDQKAKMVMRSRWLSWYIASMSVVLHFEMFITFFNPLTTHSVGYICDEYEDTISSDSSQIYRYEVEKNSVSLQRIESYQGFQDKLRP